MNRMKKLSILLVSIVVCVSVFIGVTLNAEPEQTPDVLDLVVNGEEGKIVLDGTT